MSDNITINAQNVYISGEEVGRLKAKVNEIGLIAVGNANGVLGLEAKVEEMTHALAIVAGEVDELEGVLATIQLNKFDGTCHHTLERVAKKLSEVSSEGKKLLQDYHMMQHRFACVIEHATGGRASKTNNELSVYYSMINDHVEQERQEARADAQEEMREEMGSVADILAERNRQIEKEGWDNAHDDEYEGPSLTKAAVSYCLTAISKMGAATVRKGYMRKAKEIWPWSNGWFKPKTIERDLVRAGALIAAELDRLKRKGNRA